MANLVGLLGDRLAASFATVAGEPADPVLRRSQRADFQADGALGLARRLGRSPRDIAGEVVAHVDLDDVCSDVQVAGPGFINLTVREETLGRLVADVATDPRLGVERTAEPDRVVVDYSAPNAAKEMHVGHLRSTILGDAIVRLHEHLGHRVVRQNHLGDWGTPFGMLVEHLLDVGEAEAAHELSVGDLNGFYRDARGKFDADEAFRQRSRQRVVALQAGDATTLRLWRTLVAESQKYFLAVYDRLGVRLIADDFTGESSYNDQLQDVVADLDRRGMLRVSRGAKCVFPEGFTGRDGQPLPLIVQKSDGGFGYAATDLATIRHRIRDLRGTRLLYVVGLPQQLHVRMVHQSARQAGWLPDGVRAEHVGFGSVLGSDGTMLRTRAGASVRLADLLDEAVARAAALIEEKNPDLDRATRQQVAQAVGIGAVKYSDLSTERTRDYVFDYDRMLSLDGNTAPYLQYAYVRIRSILGRAGIGAPRPDGEMRIAEPAERRLCLELLAFPQVLAEVADTCLFHKLAGYLYGLATAYTSFHETCPVLRADGPVRASRLVLCDVTARTLATGLGLLGIATPDRM